MLIDWACLFGVFIEEMHMFLIFTIGGSQTLPIMSEQWTNVDENDENSEEYGNAENSGDYENDESNGDYGNDENIGDYRNDYDNYNYYDDYYDSNDGYSNRGDTTLHHDGYRSVQVKCTNIAGKAV